MIFNAKLFALAAAVMCLMGAFVLTDPEQSDASADEYFSGYIDAYGAPTDVNLAPGFEWRYTPSFPADLTQYIVLTDIVDSGDVATINQSTKQVTVSIPAQAAVGTVYHVVLQASMTEPIAQPNAYQYIRFTVVGDLSTSGSQADIILGQQVDMTPTATTEMSGNVIWSITTGHENDGYTLVSTATGEVTWTPDSIGAKHIYLTADLAGQKSNLDVPFTVYSQIQNGVDRILTSIAGAQVSTAAQTQPADIGVTWSDNNQLPTGFTLDPSTGVISGGSSVLIDQDVTITGTRTNGPSQSTTFTVTIHSEPELVLTPGQDILTYVGNGTEATSTATASTGTSAITWMYSLDPEFAQAIPAASLQDHGMAISDNILSVQNASSAMDSRVYVKATTAYGQYKFSSFVVQIEATLTITGDPLLNAIANSSAQTSAFLINGGSDNTLACTDADEPGLNQTIVDGKLQITSASPVKDKHVTVTVTSAAGQTASAIVEIDVYSQLVFQHAPVADAIIYAI